jgi:hypothetical protein
MTLAPERRKLPAIYTQPGASIDEMRGTFGNEFSQPDTLDLTECNLVLCPIVEFGCPRRLMACHLLGVLEPAVVLQVNRDACRPPGVTSDRGEKTRGFGPLPDRSPGVVAVQSTSRHLRSGRIYALKQGLPALKACGLNVLVQNLLEQVMYGHFVLLAAFFMESQPPTDVIGKMKFSDSLINAK